MSKQRLHGQSVMPHTALQVSLALWPNKDFLDKRTKFGIDVLPLEALLDYNEDDVKECHFEVSMFAEMFREMLQTRFGRGLVRGMAIIEQEVGLSPAVSLCLVIAEKLEQSVLYREGLSTHVTHFLAMSLSRLWLACPQCWFLFCLGTV